MAAWSGCLLVTLIYNNNNTFDLSQAVAVYIGTSETNSLFGLSIKIG